MATKRIEFPTYLLPTRVSNGDKIKIDGQHLFLPPGEMDVEVIEIRHHTAIISYELEDC